MEPLTLVLSAQRPRRSSATRGIVDTVIDLAGRSFGHRPLTLVGLRTSYALTEIESGKSVGSFSRFVVVPNDEQTAPNVSHVAQAARPSLLIAIGGARLLDAVKIAGHQLGIPVALVGSSISTDCIGSRYASIAGNAGRTSIQTDNVVASVVSMELVSYTGPRSRSAGVGDLLSNISAASDWELSNRVNGEKVCVEAIQTAVDAATQLTNSSGHVMNLECASAIAGALIQSGQASNIAGSTRPVSGGCHRLGHSLERAVPGRLLHGEAALIGAAFCQYLRLGAPEESKFQDIAMKYKLESHPEKYGISPTIFIAAATHALQSRLERYSIIDQVLINSSELARHVSNYYRIPKKQTGEP